MFLYNILAYSKCYVIVSYGNGDGGGGGGGWGISQKGNDAGNENERMS